MIKGVLSKLGKQRNMPPHIGALINIYTSTAILYSPLTLMGVTTTVFGLWGADIIRGWLPWFTVWHLFIIMIGFILVAMVVFNKVVLPSIFAFQVQQQYKHRNPLVADMAKVLSKLDETQDKLEETNKRLGTLEKLVKGK